MNYSELDYPGIEDKTTKNISYSHNLYFTDDLAGKSLKIDDNLRVLDSKTEINAVNFLSEFVLLSRNERSLQGTFFCFTRDLKKKKRHFDAHDRVRMFLTATRLFTGKKADSHFDVSIKNSQTRAYYRPFDSRTDKHDFDEYRNFSAIKTRKDFNVIRKIHFRLGSANFEKTLHYSKLYNAIKFFNHAYDEHWTLLRTTLFFTALES